MKNKILYQLSRTPYTRRSQFVGLFDSLDKAIERANELVSFYNRSTYTVSVYGDRSMAGFVATMDGSSPGNWLFLGKREGESKHIKV